jgi:hypothetical protein
VAGNHQSDDQAECGSFQSREPVGSGNYTVQEGDCITSIASLAGHFWKTLWEHPSNADLSHARKSPNILLTGDILTIPPIRESSRIALPTTSTSSCERASLPVCAFVSCRNQKTHPKTDPPLEEPRTIVIEKKRLFEKEDSLNGRCVNRELSQRRGSPQDAVSKLCQNSVS